MKSLIKFVLLSMFLFIPLISYADKTSKEDMKSICVTEFAKNNSKSSDPDAYKTYTDSVCTCLADKVGGVDVSDNDISVATAKCMGSSLLSQTLANLQSDNTTLSADSIETACNKEWSIVPNTNGNKACGCFGKKVMELDKSKMSDDEWNAKIDSIASSCMGGG